jgi:hypothetical protein
MEENNDSFIDYGPLKGLIGTWRGDDGMDVSPEPDGKEVNPYYEVITFYEAGDVSNAEKQNLVAVRYHEEVKRKSNDKTFHDQVGYWIYDNQTGQVMQTLTIPRGLSLVAGGTFREEDGAITFEVTSDSETPDWPIAESPFLAHNASTKKYTHIMKLTKDSLEYSETTLVDIYSKKLFKHTDRNKLKRS